MSQGIPPKKVKVLYKRYINFEQKHGTTEQIEHAIQMTKDYVNK